MLRPTLGAVEAAELAACDNEAFAGYWHSIPVTTEEVLRPLLEDSIRWLPAIAEVCLQSAIPGLRHRSIVELVDPRRVAPTELLMLGDTISAKDALLIGLVNRLVPADAVVKEAQTLAARLAAGPSFALGVTKRLLNHELDIDFAAAIEAEAEAQALCMHARNFREFFEAYSARRAPQFD